MLELLSFKAYCDFLSWKIWSRILKHISLHNIATNLGTWNLRHMRKRILYTLNTLAVGWRRSKLWIPGIQLQYITLMFRIIPRVVLQLIYCGHSTTVSSRIKLFCGVKLSSIEVKISLGIYLYTITHYIESANIHYCEHISYDPLSMIGLVFVAILSQWINS